MHAQTGKDGVGAVGALVEICFECVSMSLECMCSSRIDMMFSGDDKDVVLYYKLTKKSNLINLVQESQKKSNLDENFRF